MRAQARGHTRSEEHDRLFIIFFYEIVDQTAHSQPKAQTNLIVQDLQGGTYVCIIPSPDSSAGAFCHVPLHGPQTGR